MSPVLSLIEAGRSFYTPAGSFHALRPLNLEVGAQTCVGVLGPSGSGKSTLLNLIAGIDRMSSGTVQVCGQNLATLNESRLAAFRGRRLGIVFQFFQLIPTLTVGENVRLAMDLVNVIPRRQRRRRALELLALVGVEAQEHKLPAALSGGEQQRVAIARALANDPPVLLADEPTGNLDSDNRAIVDHLFRKLADQGRTVLVATHDVSRLDRFDRVLELEDGVLQSDRQPAAAA
ncbi:MAG: ABC transporter ATP-binding protein [Pseudomonadota bacterium]